jgi:hypothetical protein
MRRLFLEGHGEFANKRSDILAGATRRKVTTDLLANSGILHFVPGNSSTSLQAKAPGVLSNYLVLFGLTRMSDPNKQMRAGSRLGRCTHQHHRCILKHIESTSRAYQGDTIP